MVLKLVNGSMPIQFNVVLNYILHTVAISTAIDTELWVRLVTPINSRI